jgi:hypothetical protein
MLQVEHLRYQSDALLRLFQEVEKSDISAELQEIADELRIIVSVAAVTSLADLNTERPYTGARHRYPEVGNGNGLGRESEPPAGAFSLTFLRSRRRARRALSA